MIRRHLSHSLLFLILAIGIAAATPALADVVAKSSNGSFCVQGASVPGQFTFDGVTHTVFGTPINLGSTTVQFAVTLGAGNTFSGFFSDNPLDVLFFYVPPGKGSYDITLGSFIADIDETTFMGSAAGALLAYSPAASYSFDGFFTEVSPGCFTMTSGLNAFQPQTTGTGASVSVATTTTLFHPETGTEVSIETDVTFETVSGSGETTVVAVSDAAATFDPANFSVAIGGIPVVYFDVSTTADVSGDITVCADYPDEDNNGFVDGTNDTVNEFTLSLLHDEGGTFVDRTDFDATDYVANRICATVPSLSLFVRAIRLPSVDDLDADGVLDDADNCPLIANPNQNDQDGDGAGDVCDDDVDGDGYLNDDDNCRFDANADQADADGDGMGDVCDEDRDGDGVPDADDACVPSPVGDVVNTDGCAVSDLCPCAHPDGMDRWKNHGAYVSCVAHTTNDFVEAGLLSETEKGEIQSDAGASSCGHKNK